VSVFTTMDFTTTCSATGTVGTPVGQVSAVSLTIPWANRIASNTAQSATFAFTTATALPASSANCNAANSITITFPSNFFVANAAGSCGAAAAAVTATGLTGYTLTGSGTGPSSSTTFVFTGTAALPAAAYTVVIGGLTFGTATVGSDTGITVQTSMDSVSAGAPSGPLSGYKVTSFTMPSCQASASCQNIVVAFSSNAGTILPGGTLDISFTNVPVAGTPDAFMSGSALITGAMSGSTLTLTVNANGGAWAIGSTATITLTGMTVASTGLQTAVQYASVGGSTPSYSAAFATTGAGTTTTTSLTVARPYPGVTNTQITIAFSTTKSIANNDVVRVFFPTGFFIGTPQFATCTGGDQYSVGATGLGSCNSLYVSGMGTQGASMSYFDVTYNGAGQAAGTQSMVVSGVTLSTTAVAATPTFSVVTTQNSCSAGSISTGSISASNPGGPSAPASTAAAALLSAAAALVATLLLLF